jgi:hypothetical protein
MLSRIKLLLGFAALAVALAVPGVAQAKDHGNHCGRGHAKHARAVGKSCHKHRHGRKTSVGNGTTASSPADNRGNDANDNDNEANEPNEVENENENEANEPNEVENENEADDRGNDNSGVDDGDRGGDRSGRD